jgi:ribosome-associated protein
VPDLRISPALTIPEDELTIAFARSGGPGGQNVNKVSSKAELRWTPASSRAVAALAAPLRDWLLKRLDARLTTEGEMIVISTKTRDQVRNRADAEEKLREIVMAALERPKPRRATKPTKASKERRLREKKSRAEIKRGRGRGDA